jgi:hypothetical protein
VPEHFSSRGSGKPRQHPQQRRLAATRRPKQRQNFPRHDFNVRRRNDFNAAAIRLRVKFLKLPPFENRLVVFAAWKLNRYLTIVGLRHRRIMNDLSIARKAGNTHKVFRQYRQSKCAASIIPLSTPTKAWSPPESARAASNLVIQSSPTLSPKSPTLQNEAVKKPSI